MALALRNLLRSSARRLQVRSYAAEAPKEGEMALTFAAGNKVTIMDLNSVICQIEISGTFSGTCVTSPRFELLSCGESAVVLFKFIFHEKFFLKWELQKKNKLASGVTWTRNLSLSAWLLLVLSRLQKKMR